MRKILVFTDIHFVEHGQRIGHLDPEERLLAGLRHALGEVPDAERIVICGDLAHHGRAAQYERLRAALADCPLPVHLMIGNHDRRAAFCAAFPDAPVTSTGHVQQVIDTGDFRLILLDTLDEQAEVEHSGRLCADRLSWLRAALDSSGDRRVIVFTHHPPMDVGFDAMDRIGLTNKTELLALLGAYPNVCQIISGHVHRTISGGAGGIPTALFKSSCHQSPIMRPEMDEHTSIDEPGAFGLLYLMDTGVVVHSEDFDIPGRRVLFYD
ncbi:phosphodiesterase [Roseovarius pelagicus]|uniref:Phosphodiesterase n=1 Tax=Roseovarius pelagicus TaxID=2980108 RepID=A0ABY6DD67_9RHOB|nr:phosphodiesterase [Roseovarius pelagicus]UXX84101.1 phosphodiesterase [Roseovarius pelagicus]